MQRRRDLGCAGGGDGAGLEEGQAGAEAATVWVGRTVPSPWAAMAGG
jgi:hypothetical protein